ncbi:MAG: hypothetical protein K0R63_1040 [Rickettsiales bacterium]|nr:hypothetical protein [Rickettsiales bacterium]
MAKVKVLLLGQSHTDPAAFVAASNFVKRCVDNGVKVACGYEGSIEVVSMSERISYLLLEREKLLKSSASNDEKQKALNKHIGSNEGFALYTYLIQNNITALPFECPNWSEERNAIATKHSLSFDYFHEDCPELNQFYLQSENRRISYMADQLAKLYSQFQEDRQNGLILLFNFGPVHVERLARYAKQHKEIDIDVINCIPRFTPLSLEDSKQDIIAAKKKFSDAADTPEFLKIPVSTEYVDLCYDPNQTVLGTNSDCSKITQISVPDFYDFSKLDKHLDRVIPSIRFSDHETSRELQIRADKFDHPRRKSVKFEKVRLKELSPKQLEAIQALDENVITLPDHNQGNNTYLVFFPLVLRKQIEAIQKQKPAAAKEPTQTGSWAIRTESKGEKQQGISKQ